MNSNLIFRLIKVDRDPVFIQKVNCEYISNMDGDCIFSRSEHDSDIVSCCNLRDTCRRYNLGTDFSFFTC